MTPSILGIDIGNTAIKLAWLSPINEINTLSSASVKENPLVFDKVFQKIKAQVKACVISSVVPSLTKIILDSCKEINCTPMIVSPSLDLGGVILECDECDQMGADRLTNFVATKKLYPLPAMIVSLGTATTFDVLDKNGKYLGGAIAPGLSLSSDALLHQAALLSSFPLTLPKNALGQTTETQLLSGIIYGHVGVIEEIIKRMVTELGYTPAIIVTGGNMNYVLSHLSLKHNPEPHLLLKGLQEIYTLNKKQ